MPPASESGMDKKVNDRVPDWFAKLVIAVLGMIGTSLGVWAMSSVSELRTRQAVSESVSARTSDDIKEMKGDIKRIAEAVGAKKP